MGSCHCLKVKYADNEKVGPWETLPDREVLSSLPIPLPFVKRR